MRLYLTERARKTDLRRVKKWQRLAFKIRDKAQRHWEKFIHNEP